MKALLSLILFVVLVPAFTAGANAQTAADESAPSAAQNVAELRVQLADVQAHEAELQARARQLDEDMKPENIQRSLAGVGSTRPEELREQVRRELSIQRDGVTAQLKIVTASRERLESAVRFAETQAYQQSAQNARLSPTLLLQALATSRWLIAGLASLIAVLGIVFAIVVRRRARTT
jgi:hypothetical protein